MITKVGITSIFVTHDQDEAIEVADEIIVTNKGHIEQIGTPRQIYREPETAFMAEFMGHPVHVDRINKIKGFNQLDDSVKAVLRLRMSTSQGLMRKLIQPLLLRRAWL